jgi:hypothetical protein
MADLLAEIEQYDAELFQHISAYRSASTEEELISLCIEHIHRRAMEHANAQRVDHPLIKRFIHPALKLEAITNFHAVQIMPFPPTTLSFSETVVPLDSASILDPAFRHCMVDFCCRPETKRATAWLTVRSIGNVLHGQRFADGVVRDVVGRAQWKRHAKTGWRCVSFVAINGLQSFVV